MNARDSAISMTSVALPTPMTFVEKYFGFILNPTVVTLFQREIYFPKVPLRRALKFIPWAIEMFGAFQLIVKPDGSTGARLGRIRILILKRVLGAMMNKIKQKVPVFLGGHILLRTTRSFLSTISSMARWARSLIQQSPLTL